MSSIDLAGHAQGSTYAHATRRVAMAPSLWRDSSPSALAMPPLKERLVNVDLVIIGAGFTGLTAALRAAERGARVVVLEAAEAGWGASGRNNGQVIPAMTRADPDVLVNAFGHKKGEALVQLIGGAGRTLFNLVRAHGIECDAVQNGWIQPAHRMSRMSLVRARYEQWHRRGFDVEFLDRDGAAALIGSRFWYGAWQARTGGTINPLAFVRGLATAARRAGVELFGDTPALGLHRSGTKWRIETPHVALDANKVIIATHSYSDAFSPSLWPSLPHTLLPMRSYQLATQPLPESVRATILPHRHAMSDTHGDLHVARLDRDGRLVTGGALIVPFAYAPRLKHRLGERLQRMFPQLEGHELNFDYVWHGKFAVTPDGLPRFKRLADGVYTWVGCNGRGVALSAAVGPQLADIALDDDPAESRLPIESIRTIGAHAIVKRAAMGGMLAYRWRDSRD